MKNNIIVILICLFACSAVCARPVENEVSKNHAPDVVFVSTPQDVVDKMLELAKVKKDDLVYDLGCGDGRIVVTAARKYGCKAVGYDIDPQRVKESLQNVEQNKVGHLVRIEQKDIFTLDLSRATVITLYLLPELNEKLIPQLEKLRPGSRIVSHDFATRGVRPDKVVKLISSEDQEEHKIYLWTTPLMKRKKKKQALDEHSTVSRKVLTFYYPWYGTPDGPGGAGKTVHWGRIDTANKDIQASTNYPVLGAYDSHDPELLDRHCRWARRAGIDAFIVSWWGHNSYSDRAMDKILDSCQRNGLSACIYYETVPKPQTAQTAAEDIVKVLNKYGKHPAHLKVNGKPVVFVYGRALNQLGLTSWLKAIELVNKKYKQGVTAIGDQFSYGAARVFDGVHTYNTAGSLRGLAPAAARQWAAETYQS